MKLFAPVQNEANHELEEMLGFPLLREGTRLGWLMNLNSVSGPPCLHSCTYSLDRDWQEYTLQALTDGYSFLFLSGLLYPLTRAAIPIEWGDC